MVRVYESVYTYLAFVYLFLVSVIYATIYHKYTDHQPFTILSFVIINTIARNSYRSKYIIRSVVHKHIWKTITIAFYGILVNNVHDILFRDFHSQNTALNGIVSVGYIGVIWFITYYLKRDHLAIYVHMLMFYVPIARDWEINLYLYVMYITASIMVLFTKCSRSLLSDSSIHQRSVIRFFMYIRVSDPFVLFGLLNLYLEYYTLKWEEVEALLTIRGALDEEIARVDRHIEQQSTSAGTNKFIHSITIDTDYEDKKVYMKTDDPTISSITPDSP